MSSPTGGPESVVSSMSSSASAAASAATTTIQATTDNAVQATEEVLKNIQATAQGFVTSTVAPVAEKEATALSRLQFLFAPERLLDLTLILMGTLFFIHHFLVWWSKRPTQDRLTKKREKREKEETDFPFFRFVLFLVFAVVGWEYGGCYVCAMKKWGDVAFAVCEEWQILTFFREQKLALQVFGTGVALCGTGLFYSMGLFERTKSSLFGQKNGDEDLDNSDE